MLAIESPLPLFVGRDGLPLDAGYIYFGTVNLNPVTSPVTVYWDAAGTQPVAQPVRTSRGLIVRSGTPAKVYASGNFSMMVKDSTGAQVVYERNSSEWQLGSYVDALRADLASTSDAAKGAGMVGFLQSGVGAIARTVQSKLSETVSVKDFGAALDGVTNDDAAWTAALTWASVNAPCELDCGGYGASKKTTTVLLPDGVTLNEPNLLIAANVVGLRFTGEACVRKLKMRFSGTHTNNGVDIGAVGIDAGRSVVDGADIQGAGNDGIQVRNGNLGTLRDIKSVLNGRDGINFTTETPDNNAWKLEGFLDLRGNTRDGLNFAQGSSASDPYAPKSNQGGLITVQSNGRYGLYCGTRSNEFAVYSESNGAADIYLDTYASGTHLAVLQAASITDNSTGSMITTHSMNADYIRGFINQVIFSGKTGKGLKISNDDGASGTVSLQKTGANAYKLATNNSGGSHVFSFKNDDGKTYWRFYGPLWLESIPFFNGAAPTIGSAATIAPTTPIAFVSGTTTISTITAPSDFANGGGQITLIPTGLWATNTAGNIALGSAAVVGKALILTYDATTGKWYPSY